MILAIDVHYRENLAKSVSIEFNDWEAETAEKIHTITIDEVAEYIPGAFCKRELPCILAVLNCSDLEEVDAIIVDGYVVLNDDGKKGLGAYLYEALDHRIPIIGVAKKRFYNNDRNVRTVLRGGSKKPLYVTSIGMDLELATSHVAKMKGQYRIPDLLKLVDQHTRL